MTSSRDNMLNAVSFLFGRNDPMQALVGKKLIGLAVEKERQGALRVECEGETLYYVAYGDCCSESWFADITGVDALLGGTVSEVIPVDLPDPEDDRGRQDRDLAYGYKLA